MIHKLTHALKVVSGRDVAGRNFRVFPDDTFLVSYPKSGNTWARFLLAALVNPGEVISFANIERLLPDASSQTKNTLKNTSRPRLIKSHEYFDPRYKNIIYIVRDPRDVVLSQYRFFRMRGKIDDAYSLNDFVIRFIEGSLNYYGSWGENVGSWLVAPRSGKRFLLLRYEDMLRQTTEELVKAAAFLGVSVTPDTLQRCVEQGSAERMRELEKTQGKDWVVTKGSRSDIPFVGAAKAGGWKTNLPGEQIAQIEAAWGPLIQHLGYELVSGVSTPGDSALEAVLEQPAR